MPRPKCKKAPLALTTRVPPSTAAKKHTPRHTSSDSVVGDRDNTNSDDSAGIVKRSNKSANRNGVPPKDVRMSGALAPGNSDETTRPKSVGRNQRDMLSKMAREADHAKANEALKVRRDASLARGQAEADHEDVLVPSSMPRVGDKVRETHTPEPDAVETARIVERVKPILPSSRKLYSTPGVDASILALANFKRRSRKPSILRIGRKDEVESDNELEIDRNVNLDDDLDDFQPDDESTPFHISRPRAEVQGIPIQKVPSSISSQSHSSLRSRKRKLSTPEVQVPRSQSSPLKPTLAPAPITRKASPESAASSVQANQPSDSEPILPLPITRVAHTPDIWSDTMAPPQSSSPPRTEPSPQKPPPTIKSHGTQTTSRKKLQKAQTSRKEPQTTHAPAHSPPKPQPLRPISTATLQTLLPRRRRRPATRNPSAFDILSSSDVDIDNDLDLEPDTPTIPEGEDELSFAAPPTAKPRRKAKPRPTMNPPKTKRIVKGKSKPSTKIDTGVKKTYGRRISDKENATVSRAAAAVDGGGGEAGNVSAMSVEKEEELRGVARKFAEVDRWEMEFEEITASSSSPKDAR